MYVASRSTVRWYLALCAIYLALGALLSPYIPERFACQARGLYVASVFALCGILCVLVGTAGLWSPVRRDEHPIAFWTIVGMAWSFSALFLFTALGVFPSACNR